MCRYETHEIALNCGMMLRECCRYEALAKIMLYSSEFYKFFSYVEVSTFDIASDAFSTFKVRFFYMRAAVWGVGVHTYACGCGCAHMRVGGCEHWCGGVCVCVTLGHVTCGMCVCVWCVCVCVCDIWTCNLWNVSVCVCMCV